MMSLSSTGVVLAALQRARVASLSAYILRPGVVEDALLDAARRGARVTVRLEGQPYADSQGALLAGNRSAVAALRAAGADAQLVHESGSSGGGLHAKMLVTDDALYLDDRNWAGDGEETIVRDTFAQDRTMAQDAIAGDCARASPFFAVRKHDALASEARLLRSARSNEDVIVESESFGAYNAAYDALDDLARDGGKPRVLVAERELQNNAKELAVLQALVRDGASVRVTPADEKFALAGERGWIGSANLSAAFGRPDQIDWSVRTDDPVIIAHERAAFESRWTSAQALPQPSR